MGGGHFGKLSDSYSENPAAFTICWILKHLRFSFFSKLMPRPDPHQELIDKWREEGLTELQIEERIFALEEAERDKEEIEFLRDFRKKEKRKEKKLHKTQEMEEEEGRQDEFGDLVEEEQDATGATGWLMHFLKLGCPDGI